MPNLNSDIVGSFKLGLPAIEQQRVFDVRRGAAKAQIELTEHASTQLDTLFASLQQRAFAGEL